jgi:hypothetical protein
VFHGMVSLKKADRMHWKPSGISPFRASAQCKVTLEKLTEALR